MAVRENQERIWIAASLHKRIKGLKRRTGRSMVRVANALIRDGLKLDAAMRRADRLIKARRDGRSER